LHSPECGILVPTMQPDDWDRVQSAFFAVVDLPPGEQALQLNRTCGDDNEFRAKVESLLAADHESEEVISAAIADEKALWASRHEVFPGTGSAPGK
jgi:hypothetical protein